MLASFRRLSKTKLGTAIVALFFVVILIGFAASDLSNVGTGNIGFGMGGSTLAEAGDQKVTDSEMSDAMLLAVSFSVSISRGYHVSVYVGGTGTRNFNCLTRRRNRLDMSIKIFE